ncbi:MAG: leucyl aminopeptidase [Holosporales bacterium]|nr:leucyl aminopeptidase [Holosporales bacterium]
MLKITFSDQKPTQGVVAFGVFQDNVFSLAGQSFDKESGSALTRALSATYFKGGTEEVQSLLACGSFERVVLFGLGKEKALSESQAYGIGGSLVAHLLKTPHKSLTVMVEDLSLETVVAIAFGAALRGWQFDKYQTRLKESQKISLQEVIFCVKNPKIFQEAFEDSRVLAESILWARELVAEPANVLFPRSYMDKINDLKSLGLTVESLDKGDMEKLGMGAILGVAQGSPVDPYLGIVHWNGGKEGEAPIAFVGKGVTFDSGGISIKPSSNMDEMKADMAGSAAVLGAIRALAARKAPVNAVAVVALVENMPSGTAQRPGDIVHSMSGQTIEVLNTDAEGRLILADALYYTQERFNPRFMVDLATLTGAMRVALGGEYAGLFSEKDELAHALEAAGQEVGEKVWRLPMGKAYDKEIDSSIADMKNIAAPGCGAGSIIGAQFLGRFVGNTPWAHIDIANVDMSSKSKALSPRGPVGFGIALLNRWVKNIAG